MSGRDGALYGDFGHDGTIISLSNMTINSTDKSCLYYSYQGVIGGV